MDNKPTLIKCAEACRTCKECKRLTRFAFENDKTNCRINGCKCRCQFHSDEDTGAWDYGCIKGRSESKDFDLYHYISEGKLLSITFQFICKRLIDARFGINRYY